MQFQRHRLGHLVADSYDSSSQQFLTFRNNPDIQNTGRSIFSQPFDYRSLQKQKHHKQQQPALCNMRKNIKQIRSQQKYKQVIGQSNAYNNLQSKGEQSLQRNRQLKRRQSRLLKKIKGEQSRRVQLQAQMHKIMQILQSNQEMFVRQGNDIQELVEIKQENQNNLADMEDKIRSFQAQAKQYQEQVSDMNSSLEFEAKSIETARNKAKELGTQDIHKQLVDGIQELTVLSQTLSSRIESYQRDIGALREELEAIRHVDAQIQHFSY